MNTKELTFKETLKGLLMVIDGKKVSFIDCTNYLLRMNGTFNFDKNRIVVKKGNTCITLLFDSIVSFRELKSDSDTKNIRFKLHNGHSFDIVYEIK